MTTTIRSADAIRSPIFLFLAGALVATVWRPWILGFLTDDWSVLVAPTIWSPPFSYARWEALEIAQNRPVLRILLFVLTSIIPASPPIWHAVGAIANIAAGAAVAICVHDLLVAAGDQRAAQWSGVFAGLCWIAFPWSVATQFWATGTTALLAVICFAASVSLLVRNWQGSIFALLGGAALSLIGYLTYEAFYFQIFPVILYLAWTRGWRLRSSQIAIVSYTVAQFIAVAFNHMMRLQGAEASRRINASFVDTFFHWYLYAGRVIGIPRLAIFAGLVVAAAAMTAVLYAMRHRFAHITLLFATSTAIATVCAGAVLLTLPLAFPETILLSIAGAALVAYVCFFRPAQAGIPSLAAIFLLAFAGIALGALPFALGNYVVFSLGFGARATLASSLWITLALGAVSSLALQQKKMSNLALAGLALIWLGFIAGDALRAREWGRAADLLNTVFQDPPPFPFSEVGSGVAYVLVGPEQTGWVPVIEVNHHVSAIAWVAFLPQAKAHDRVTLLRGWDGHWIVARTLVWSTQWDGARLTQRLCNGGEVFNTMNVRELLVWDTQAHRISKARPPFSIGCQVDTQ